MSSQQSVIAVIIVICLAGLLFMTISLIYDWFKDKSTNGEPHKSPWSMGDAVKFGFGFGMGMFLWAVFAVVIGALILWLFISGGINIASFFTPSNTQINGSAGGF